MWFKSLDLKTSPERCCCHGNSRKLPLPPNMDPKAPIQMSEKLQLWEAINDQSSRTEECVVHLARGDCSLFSNWWITKSHRSTGSALKHRGKRYSTDSVKTSNRTSWLGHFLNSKMTSGYISSTLNVAKWKKKRFTSRYSDNRKLQSREHTQENQDSAIGSTVFHEARRSVNFVN